MEQGIPAGYKQTEVGVIPDGWDVRSLLDVVDFANGKPHEHDIAPSGRYWLVTLDSIDINGRLKDEHRRVNVWDDSLKRDDIVAVLSDLAHGNLLGLCDVVPRDGAYVLNQRMARLRPKANDNSLFIKLQINRKQRHFKARGQGTSQRHIYKRAFAALRIPVPSQDEQHAIADALGDMDALLDALDRLIAKQRDLKQVAMQQLLTGRTRLPGFTGEWATRRLGDLGAAYGGLVGKTKDDFGVGDGRYIPFVNVMANTRIDVQALGRVRVGAAEIQNTVRAGDLVFNGSSETPEEVAMCAVLEADVPNLFLNSFCFGFRFLDMAAVEPLFLSYYFRADVGRALISSLAQGSTRYNISKSAFLKAAVKLPTHAEQTAIAAVLSDLDAEIAALEARRTKTRDLKQAMLQELLTGRTRLI